MNCEYWDPCCYIAVDMCVIISQFKTKCKSIVVKIWYISKNLLGFVESLTGCICISRISCKATSVFLHSSWFVFLGRDVMRKVASIWISFPTVNASATTSQLSPLLFLRLPWTTSQNILGSPGFHSNKKGYHCIGTVFYPCLLLITYYAWNSWKHYS